MRPAGGGIPAFSAGSGSALELQRRLYAVAAGKPGPILDEAGIEARWKESFAALARAKAVIIGVPLDTGAGIRRGAAYGPRAVRTALLTQEAFAGWLRSGEVVDLGDLYVNPHLLHDEMLNDSQIRACQEAMYANAPESLRRRLPVSALSQLKFLLGALLAAYPRLKPFVIGGDHSAAWPVTEVLADKYSTGNLGIVQPDAHTDLLASRLGVKYCFGTWSFHANERLGGGGRLVQLGIRQSGKDRAHWESSTGVRQFWASEIRGRPPGEVIDELVAHLKSAGVRQLYFSNDIDGTDESEASATGTPAGDGLSSAFLLQAVEALGKNFEWVAADIMEVAPDLGPDREASERTSELAARYAIASLRCLLGQA